MAAGRGPLRTVIAALDRAIAAYGKPQAITCDNGTEFTSNHFDAWAHQAQSLAGEAEAQVRLLEGDAHQAPAVGHRGRRGTKPVTIEDASLVCAEKGLRNGMAPQRSLPLTAQTK
jgi:hypothetical protein